MKTISLSEQQIKNALLFLNRVECKGIQEATALVELVSALTETMAGGTRTPHEETAVPEKDLKGASNGTD
jgi:hypothetical protein